MYDLMSLALRQLDLMDKNLDRSNNIRKLSAIPASDVFEYSDNWLIRVELPGVSKEDISLEIKDSWLIVRGERNSDTSKDDQKIRIREISRSSFERKFKLGEDVNVEDIDAKLENGILDVKIPKETKKSLEKKIRIK